MPKSKREKIDYAIELLNKEHSYREIQQHLIDKYGSGMSNSTLKKLQNMKPNVNDLLKENENLKKELALYKRLYFELFEATKEKIGKNEK